MCCYTRHHNYADLAWAFFAALACFPAWRQCVLDLAQSANPAIIFCFCCGGCGGINDTWQYVFTNVYCHYSSNIPGCSIGAASNRASLEVDSIFGFNILLAVLVSQSHFWRFISCRLYAYWTFTGMGSCLVDYVHCCMHHFLRRNVVRN